MEEKDDLSPPFIYLFNSLFISLWTHGYLFYSIVIIQYDYCYCYYCYYFVAQIVLALSIKSSFKLAPVLF